MIIRKFCGSIFFFDVIWKGVLRFKENGREYCLGCVKCGINLVSVFGCCLGNRVCSV